MTSLRNNPILIAVIAAALATAAFWFLALSPKHQEAADLQTQITAKQGEVDVARQQLATYERARTSYKASYTTLARLGKAVPADDDIRSLLVQLDTAGNATHVDFTKLSVGGDGGGSGAATAATTPATSAGGLAPAPGSVQVGSTGISAMPFALQFSGSYSNLTGFFNRLDHFVAVHNRNIRATGRLLRIETIALTPSEAGYPRMTAQVNAASYLVAPTTPAAGTPPPATSPATPASSSTPSTTTATATITGAAR